MPLGPASGDVERLRDARARPALRRRTCWTWSAAAHSPRRWFSRNRRTRGRSAGSARRSSAESATTLRLTVSEELRRAGVDPSLTSIPIADQDSPRSADPLDSRESRRERAPGSRGPACADRGGGDAGFRLHAAHEDARSGAGGAPRRAGPGSLWMPPPAPAERVGSPAFFELTSRLLSLLLANESEAACSPGWKRRGPGTGAPLRDRVREARSAQSIAARTARSCGSVHKERRPRWETATPSPAGCSSPLPGARASRLPAAASEAAAAVKKRCIPYPHSTFRRRQPERTAPPTYPRAAPAKPATRITVCDEVVERRPERARIATYDELSGDTVLDRVHEPADRRGHDRAAVGHRLVRDEAVALAPGRTQTTAARS